MSPYVGNLSFLRYLNLANNSFHGFIPPEIGRLLRLKNLILSHNTLEGEIPRNLSLCLSLDRSPLPSETFPPLEELNIWSNNLTGGVPISISQTRLKIFNAGENQLIGGFSSALYNLSSLNILSLTLGLFSGSIRRDISLLLPNLQIPCLGFNQFTGPNPDSLSNVTNLAEIDIVSNNFTGCVPASFGRLQNLRWLGLGSNFLRSGATNSLSFLADLANCSNLELLDLQHNQFEGEIPTTLGNCLGFKEPYIQANHFRGPIPQFEGLKGLRFLNLSNNNLSGQVPEFLVNLSSSLQFLNLSFNNLEGEVPVRGIFGNNSAFKVDGNQELCGGIPELHLLSCTAKLLPRSKKHISSKLMKGAFKGFLAECKALGSIRHRNLVKILTACSSIDSHRNDFKALVYEYMCRTPIVHCDLKPSNILLNDDFTAHISDFGLSRLIFNSNKDIFSSHPSSCAFLGTMGYIAPEYGMGVRPSTSGDVYSFGILFLEMFTGRRPTDSIVKEDFNLQKFVESELSKGATGILDQSIFCGEVGESMDEEGIWRVWNRPSRKSDIGF
ncbi:probable LRR receptor-like serine/threonine-protein kinase At3g47570 [Eucalyptus grandis]|uniref:probable LRR receptor-like serine/threonine-protein kinase At3g47570 n=1 Tax=Eucalyptus grandis TaxID=71139 RepID=UPI00192EFFFF|nr:probable LRR receptor-like serine/threonine-protein kinase At3g47570 [Eucalyptus grandis]